MLNAENEHEHEHEHEHEKRVSFQTPGTPLLDEENEYLAVTMDEEADRTREIVVQTWKYPLQNIYRTISASYGFIVFGMTDASVGVLLPSFEKYYDIDYTMASLAFLSPFCGYLVSALSSNYIHTKIGRWGVSVVGTGAQLVCFTVCVFGPPFPVYVIAYAVAGLGNGLIQAGWDAWASGLASSNTILGFLHACYGLGATICPTIFTIMMQRGVVWHYCYALMVVMCGISFTTAIFAWWGDTARLYFKEVVDEAPASSGGEKVYQGGVRAALRSKKMWSLASILFLYTGTEVGIGGWLTTFMIEQRHGDRHEMGYVTTGFWAGLTVGRLALGILTEYVQHEELCMTVYLAVSVAVMALFWAIDQLVVSAVCAAFFGLVFGPTFQLVMVVAGKRLPRSLHVSGMGLIAATGGAGAALLPFLQGIVVNNYGAGTVPVYGFVLTTAMLVAWILVVKFA